MNGKCMIWQARNRALALFEEATAQPLGRVAHILSIIKETEHYTTNLHIHNDPAVVHEAFDVQDECFKVLQAAGCLTND